MLKNFFLQYIYLLQCSILQNFFLQYMYCRTTVHICIIQYTNFPCVTTSILFTTCFPSRTKQNYSNPKEVLLQGIPQRINVIWIVEMGWPSLWQFKPAIFIPFQLKRLGKLYFHLKPKKNILSK